jgi:RNA polymerase sigma-70 factor (ECF subfamily)
VVARICLDRLRARRTRNEESDGDVVTTGIATTAPEHDPEQQALMAESVGAALLVVLDLLPPAERVAFVLHDVFGMPFDEIGAIVDRSPEAARQLASRGRRRVRGRTETASVDLVQQRDVVHAFLRAAQGGDFGALVQLLDPNVVLHPDEAALRMGSMQETRGAEAVAGMLSGGAKAARIALIEGVTGLVWAPGRGPVRGAIQFVVDDDGKIVALQVTGDSERLEQLDIVVLE